MQSVRSWADEEEQDSHAYSYADARHDIVSVYVGDALAADGTASRFAVFAHALVCCEGREQGHTTSDRSRSRLGRLEKKVAPTFKCDVFRGQAAAGLREVVDALKDKVPWPRPS